MWLLDQAVWESMRQVRLAGFDMTSEQREAFLALQTSEEVSTGSRILSIAGNNAEILIEGVLTKNPDFFALFLGGGNTTYGEIISALAQVENDPAVDNIVLRIDSPGGTIDGLFPALEAIQKTTKPIKAVVTDLAASAAFALATKADSIIAANKMSRFGSVGVVARFFVSENEIEISSTDAPKKAPDVTTEDGAAIIREQLDAIHNVFVSEIASGRGMTEETVNAEFGRGAVILAEDAVSRGMIDSILGSSVSATNNDEPQTRARISGELGANAMETIEQLRQEHPSLFAKAMQLGVDEERDRVCAHLTYGAGAKAMDVAVKAIKDGSPMTETLRAEYMVAGRNAADLSAIAGDDAATSAAASDTNAPDKDKVELDAEYVANGIEDLFGIAHPTKVMA